jgi:hypothetical protein
MIASVARHAGELRHLQAVAADLAGDSGALPIHRVQEHELIRSRVLGGIEVHVGDGPSTTSGSAHARELEVVRGEQREGACIGREPRGGRPGQRQPVEGAGAAADLVHQHQAALGGVVQDVRGLGHLDHEGGAAAGEVVRRADAREDAVERAQISRAPPARNCRCAPASRSAPTWRM